MPEPRDCRGECAGYWSQGLYGACKDRRWDDAKGMLRGNADPNLYHDDGMTALHQAAFRAGGEEVVKLLIEHGAEINARTNGRVGRTPLPKAIQGGNAESERILRAAGGVDYGDNGLKQYF